MPIYALGFILAMDCTKGFNYISRSWVDRVLVHAGLPVCLRNAIMHLLCNQCAILVYCGFVFPKVQWKSGSRQGGPLSILIFLIAVAPFLSSLMHIDGVESVFRFCDDWQLAISGMHAIAQI